MREPPFARLVRVVKASDNNFNLPGFNGKRQAALGSHFQTKRYRLFYILESLPLGLTLTDTTGN